MEHIADICRNYPQILVFLALAIGYFVGRIKVRGFSIGPTLGVLIAALVLGQINVEIPSLLNAVAFALFIFCIGYKVGPQFFRSLEKEGLKYISIAIVIAAVGLAVAILMGKVFDFDKGTTAGLLGGAMTNSATIGTADGAISHLSISAAAKSTLTNNVAIAYAMTYVFGTAGLILFVKFIPRIMRIDLKKEARKLEEEMSGGAAETERPELFSWYKRLNLRAYRVTNENVTGKTIGELEAMFQGMVAVEKMKRQDQIIEPEPDTVIKSGDVVALAGDRRQLINVNETVGPEVDDRSVLDLIGEILEICILKPDAVGKTLGEISAEHGHGIFLRRITRQGHELPLARGTVVDKCDLLQVAGAERDVESLVKYLGYPERPTVITDLVVVGLGIVLGTLLGLLAVHIGGIPLTLGVGGGVLVSGLVFGWLRSFHPTFGQIPGAAQWIFTDLGLNLFIACVGLTAGPEALSALKTMGASLLLAGVVVTLTPMIVGFLFGRQVLKLNPALLLGALTGGGTCTAALNVVKEDADSPVPALGYTVSYAFGNIFLTIWGVVLVNVM